MRHLRTTHNSCLITHNSTKDKCINFAPYFKQARANGSFQIPMESKKIQSALISVYYKDGLAPIVELLHKNGVKLYSTGGTQTFIEDLGIPVTAVEDLTS